MESINLSNLDLIMGLDTNSKEFKEFSETLNEISLIANPELYMEAVQSPDGKVTGFVKDAGKNTISTTKDVASIYGRTVNANASLIKTVWDLFIKCTGLTVKALDFTMKKISIIPKLLLALINKVTNIPDDIRNKIRGNIKLYITAEDIMNLYQKQILVKIDKFIGLSKILSNGDTWGTMFNRRIDSTGVISMPTNDMQICRKMAKLYEQLRLTEFTQTVIQMDDPGSVNTYFGNKKVIKFYDLDGKHHEETYLESLNTLISDIDKRRGDLEGLRSSISLKYSESKLKESFSRLHGSSQSRITNTIQMMSKIIGTIGNIVRYVTIDIKTINDAVDKMVKKKQKAATKDKDNASEDDKTKPDSETTNDKK